MMTITVNGEIKQIQENISVQDLIKELEYDNKWMGIAVNTTFVPKDKHDKFIIKDGDKIEILSPISGG